MNLAPVQACRLRASVCVEGVFPEQHEITIDIHAARLIDQIDIHAARLIDHISMRSPARSSANAPRLSVPECVVRCKPHHFEEASPRFCTQFLAFGTKFIVFSTHSIISTHLWPRVSLSDSMYMCARWTVKSTEKPITMTAAIWASDSSSSNVMGSPVMLR